MANEQTIAVSSSGTLLQNAQPLAAIEAQCLAWNGILNWPTYLQGRRHIVLSIHRRGGAAAIVLFRPRRICSIARCACLEMVDRFRRFVSSAGTALASRRPWDFLQLVSSMSILCVQAARSIWRRLCRLAVSSMFGRLARCRSWGSGMHVLPGLFGPASGWEVEGQFGESARQQRRNTLIDPGSTSCQDASWTAQSGSALSGVGHNEHSPALTCHRRPGAVLPAEALPCA